MSAYSQFMYSSTKGVYPNGPGSNGYWRRDMFIRPGSYTFKVKKSGKLKIVGFGAAGGSGRGRAGSSGGCSVHEAVFDENDIITLAVGAGGVGATSSADGGDGGTTTIVCASKGVSITLTGGIGGRSGGTGQTAGTASGGNVANFNGAVGQAESGGPASASPFGNAAVNNGLGGGGWGGPSSNIGGGASSHFPGSTLEGAPGLTSRGGFSWVATGVPVFSLSGDSGEFWDIGEADGGGGGGAANSGSSVFGGNGGVGAGGGFSNSASGGVGGFGGGGGKGSSSGGNGGNGGGGGTGGSSAGGSGGAGAVFIYWDEVA